MKNVLGGTDLHVYILQKLNPTPRRLQELMGVSRTFRKAATSDVLWEPFKTRFLQYLPSFADYFVGTALLYEAFCRLTQLTNLNGLTAEQIADVGYLHIEPLLRPHVTVCQMENELYWLEYNTGRVCGVFTLNARGLRLCLAPLRHFLATGVRSSNKRPFNKEMSILHIQAIAQRRKRRKQS